MNRKEKLKVLIKGSEVEKIVNSVCDGYVQSKELFKNSRVITFDVPLNLNINHDSNNYKGDYYLDEADCHIIVTLYKSGIIKFENEYCDRISIEFYNKKALCYEWREFNFLDPDYTLSASLFDSQEEDSKYGVHIEDFYVLTNKGWKIMEDYWQEKGEQKCIDEVEEEMDFWDDEVFDNYLEDCFRNYINKELPEYYMGKIA